MGTDAKIDNVNEIVPLLEQMVKSKERACGE